MELKVVPDPLAFPEWRDVPIGGVPWRPWMAQPNRRVNPSSVYIHTQQTGMTMRETADAVKLLQQQLRAGMISVDEARAMIGEL